MIRRGQQGRRQLRRAERETAKKIETNHGSYSPPDRAAAIEWEPVEYIDCCHGHCHLHTRNDESPRSIAPLNCVDDVQHAYTAAVALIHDRLRIIGT